MLDTALLPSEVRRELLRQLRLQLGDFEYERLVDAVGEERLLSMALQAAVEERPVPPPPKPRLPAPVRWIGYAVGYPIVACWWFIVYPPFFAASLLAAANSEGWRHKVIAGLVVSVSCWIALVVAVKEDRAQGWFDVLYGLYWLAVAIAGIVYVIWGLVQAAR